MLSNVTNDLDECRFELRSAAGEVGIQLGSIHFACNGLAQGLLRSQDGDFGGGLFEIMLDETVRPLAGGLIDFFTAGVHHGQLCDRIVISVLSRHD